jgi:hypothetical protein
MHIQGRTPQPVPDCVFFSSPAFGAVLARNGHNFESGN